MSYTLGAVSYWLTLRTSSLVVLRGVAGLEGAGFFLRKRQKTLAPKAARQATAAAVIPAMSPEFGGDSLTLPGESVVAASSETELGLPEVVVLVSLVVCACWAVL